MDSNSVCYRRGQLFAPRLLLRKPRTTLRYHVILWDDPDTRIEYVIEMMQKLFHKSATEGRKIAEEVDNSGRATMVTTTLEHAELKRDQITAYAETPYSMKSNRKHVCFD